MFRACSVPAPWNTIEKKRYRLICSLLCNDGTTVHNYLSYTIGRHFWQTRVDKKVQLFMKKIVLIMFVVLGLAIPVRSMSRYDKNAHCTWNTAFSAGYVFKNDCRFKAAYGLGVVNALTVDGCYYPWKYGGFGLKASYWFTQGDIAFLGKKTLFQEVPVTIYARGTTALDRCAQLYGSLGGGFVWMNEKSFLGTTRVYKGIAEAEVGVNCCIYRALFFTSAFRYLFPPQCVAGERFDVGGCDVRAGLGFSF